VEGRTLKESLTSYPLPLTKVVDYTIQICEGLQKAHDAGIVHRDIKPQNIIINKDGQIKILDFGLAKLKGVSQLTKESSTMGTTHYLSPEQTMGEEVDHRADIWSLGVVLYEMITGQLPYKGEYEQAVIYSIINEDPEPVTSLRTGVPEELERIVDKALSKSSNERYQQINETIEDLERFRMHFESGDFKEKKEKTIPSIAVLPFLDMSPQKDQEYFCEGMAEELINAFVKIEGLRVTSRTSSFQFTGKGYDIQEINKKLKVETILEGSVRKAGNRLRITAQLINVADGFHIWSDKYDRDAEDIFAIQDEISLAIVDHLKLKLLKEEKAKLVKRYTDNKKAHDLYLKGRYFWNRRYEGGLQKGMECFKKAIEEDPFFAQAYVGIADSHNLLGIYGFSRPIETFAISKKAIQKALEIDCSLPEAYASLGMIKLWFDWDWQGAERAFQKAISLNPNYSFAHEWYALYLAVMGRSEEAVKEIEKAIELEPLELITNTLAGGVLYVARRFDEALMYFEKTIEIDPGFPMVYLFQGATFFSMDLLDQSITAYQKLVSLTNYSPISLANLGTAYAKSGHKDSAMQYLQKLEHLAEKRYISPYDQALVYMGLDDFDRAFEFLEKAYQERDNWLICFKQMAFFDTLRADPRFKQLLKKIGHKT